MVSSSRVSFNELPEDVQSVVEVILKHRARILRFAKGIIPAAVVGNIVSAAVITAQSPNKEKVALPALIGTSLLFSTGGLVMLYEHKIQYKKEYDLLLRELKESTNPAVRSLWEKNPYLVVDAKGGLVGKKFAPKVGFLPVGRQRVATRVKPPIFCSVFKRRKKVSV